MYDAIVQEIADMQQDLIYAIQNRELYPDQSFNEFETKIRTDQLRQLLFQNRAAGEPSIFDHTFALISPTQIKDVNVILKQSNKFKGSGAEIINTIVPSFQSQAISAEQINKVTEDIAFSSGTEEFDVISPETGEVLITLYTPEEKTLAVELLKSISDDKLAYERWFDAVKKPFISSDNEPALFSVNEAAKVLAAVKD